MDTDCGITDDELMGVECEPKTQAGALQSSQTLELLAETADSVTMLGAHSCHSSHV